MYVCSDMETPISGNHVGSDGGGEASFSGGEGAGGGGGVSFSFFFSISCFRSEKERMGAFPSSIALVSGLTILGLVGGRSMTLGYCSRLPPRWSRLPPPPPPWRG